MSLSLFHPVVARWFQETLGEPTAAQRKGWPAIRAGFHTLIAAPTGSGKTLAAFLTVLDDLFQEGLRAPLPDEVRVLWTDPDFDAVGRYYETFAQTTDAEVIALLKEAKRVA